VLREVVIVNAFLVSGLFCAGFPAAMSGCATTASGLRFCSRRRVAHNQEWLCHNGRGLPDLVAFVDAEVFSGLCFSDTSGGATCWALRCAIVLARSFGLRCTDGGGGATGVGATARSARPAVLNLFDVQERIYGPVVMSGVVVFFVLGVCRLGIFSDTIVGATDRCWMLVVGVISGLGDFGDGSFFRHEWRRYDPAF
jgi:hypothetical protein